MKLRLLIPLLAMLATQGAYSAPRERSIGTRISYGVGKKDVNPDFKSNGRAINMLDNLLAPDSDAKVLRVEIRSLSSPDGPYSVNKRLTSQRAGAAVDFLKDRYPSLRDTLYIIKTVDEDWDGVARYLRNSDKPWKDDALKIIKAGGNDRKALLQDLWVGEAWDDLVKNAFPFLRRTEIHVVIEDKESQRSGVLFRRGYRQLDQSIGENSALLEKAKEQIENGYDGTITLTGYYSPDGSVSSNEKLSIARANNLKEYFTDALQYPEDKILVKNGGVDWEKFALRIQNSYYYDDKAEVLAILRDNYLSSSQKKQALLRFNGGQTWQVLKEDIMSSLSYVDISFDDYTSSEVQPLPVVEPAVSEPQKEPEQEPVVTADPVQEIEQELELEPVTEQVAEPIPEPVPEPEPEPESPPVLTEPATVAPKADVVSKPKVIFGFETNALLDAGTALNVSLDLFKGKNWNVSLDYIFPWWKDRSKSFAFQLQHLDVGARYYFKPWEAMDSGVMRGWFSSTSIGVGYYDFAPFGDGVQGEELKFSIGGGYTWALSEWWRMTAELGVGPILTQYRVYTAEAPDRLVVTDEQARVFWGITNAKFSFSYLFHTRPRGR